jgi:hypothetical protein
MERNGRCSSLVRMCNPNPLFFLGLWCYTAIMVTLEQKAFCVLQFMKRESVVSVQLAFWRQFNSDPPSPNSIRCWFWQFQTSRCLFKWKSAGRLHVLEESMERVRQSFLRGPKKSVHCASRELEMSSMTVWRVLQKRLQMKPRCLHLLQLLKPTDHIDWTNFYIKMQDAMTEEGFLDHVVFSDESTFHISGEVHRHNVCIWGTENRHKMVQHERASPKISVFVQCPHERFMGLKCWRCIFWQLRPASLGGWVHHP